MYNANIRIIFKSYSSGYGVDWLFLASSSFAFCFFNAQPMPPVTTLPTLPSNRGTRLRCAASPPFGCLGRQQVGTRYAKPCRLGACSVFQSPAIHIYNHLRFVSSFFLSPVSCGCCAFFGELGDALNGTAQRKCTHIRHLCCCLCGCLTGSLILTTSLIAALF